MEGIEIACVKKGEHKKLFERFVKVTTKTSTDVSDGPQLTGYVSNCQYLYSTQQPKDPTTPTTSANVIMPIGF